MTSMSLLSSSPPTDGVAAPVTVRLAVDASAASQAEAAFTEGQASAAAKQLRVVSPAPADPAPVITAAMSLPSVGQPGFAMLSQGDQRAGLAQTIEGFFAGEPSPTITRDQFMTVVKALFGTQQAEALWSQLDGSGEGRIGASAIENDLANGHVFRDVFGKMFGLDQVGAASDSTILVTLISHDTGPADAAGLVSWLDRDHDGKVSARDLDDAFGSLENASARIRPFELTV